MGTPHGTVPSGGAGTVGRVNAPRRSPNFTRFIAAGAVVGFVVGGGLAVLGDPAPGYGEGAAVAYIGLFAAAIGAMLAAVLAVLLDRRG